jgi:hypothetical protein
MPATVLQVDSSSSSSSSSDAVANETFLATCLRKRVAQFVREEDAQCDNHAYLPPTDWSKLHDVAAMQTAILANGHVFTCVRALDMLRRLAQDTHTFNETEDAKRTLVCLFRLPERVLSGPAHPVSGSIDTAIQQVNASGERADLMRQIDTLLKTRLPRAQSVRGQLLFDMTHTMIHMTVADAHGVMSECA